jgi:hypothetical protein
MSTVAYCVFGFLAIGHWSNLFVLFFSGGTGFLAQGFVLGRQVLQHLIQPPIQFCFT